MLYDKKWDKEVPVKLRPEQEALLKAADLLRTAGWCRTRRRDEAGRYCLLGSICEISEGVERENAIELVRNYLNFGGRPLWVWNDASSRTKEEVIAALEGAAKQGA